LASALFYGLKSDTRDLGREVSPPDVWAYSYLVPRTNMPMVSAIEHPRLPRNYFSVLVTAINTARVYDGNVAVCDLGPCYVPDLVPEIADRLLQGEGIRWSIVVGEYEDEIYASIRVSDRRFSAGKLAREAVKGIEGSSAGGHGSMAGARLAIPDKTRSPRARTRARRAFMKKMASLAGAETSGPGEKFTAPPTEDPDTAPRNGGAERPEKKSGAMKEVRST
jgi:nanoRNase/pAp phosphatase (c-di-AMP/oligoRNAs hydrolase)